MNTKKQSFCLKISIATMLIVCMICTTMFALSTNIGESKNYVASLEASESKDEVADNTDTTSIPSGKAASAGLVYAAATSDATQAMVTVSPSAAAAVVIPAVVPSGTLAGRKVVEIADAAFNRNTTITSVDMSDATNLKTIGLSAFQGTTNLKGDLVIPNSVTTIGLNAFFQAQFDGTLTLGTGLTTIGVSAFRDINFTGNLVIPANVTNIGNRALALATGSSYDSVTFEHTSSVPTLGSTVFHSMSALMPIYVKNTAMYNAVKANAGGGTVQYADGNLVYLPNAAGNGYVVKGLNLTPASTAVNVPAMFDSKPVTEIGAQAFLSNETITSVDLSKATNLLIIGTNAFTAAKNVTGNLVIPNSVTTIRAYAFNGTGFDGTFTLGSGLATIGDYAFYGVKFTGNLVIPASVTSIGKNVFGDVTFTSVTFEHTTAPTLGTDVFKSLPTANPIYVKNMAVYSAVNSYKGGGTVYATDNKLRYVADAAKTGWVVKDIYPGATVTNLVIGATFASSPITEIATNAFKDNKTITSLVLSNAINLESIGDNTFRLASNLKGDLVIPNSLTTIGAQAFYGSGLDGTLTLGSSVTSIGVHAFGSTKLASVTFEHTNAPTLGTNVFSSLPTSTPIYVNNQAMYTAVKTAAGGGRVHEYFYADVTGGVSLTGVASSITALVVPAVFRGKNVVEIANSAFYNNKTITSVSFSSATNLKTISDYAFEGVTNFDDDLVIPATVTSIGTSAFANGKFISVTFEHTTAPRLGASVFQSVPGYVKIYVKNMAVYNAVNSYRGGGTVYATDNNLRYVPDTTTGAWAVAGVYTGVTITNLVIGATFAGTDITSIGTEAFRSDRNITSVSLLGATNLVRIEESAFYTMEKLRGDLVIPNSVTHIGKTAFYNTKINGTLTLGSGLISIGEAAFDKTAFTGDLVIPAKVANIGARAFASNNGLTSVTFESVVVPEIGAEILFYVNRATYYVKNQAMYDAVKAHKGTNSGTVHQYFYADVTGGVSLTGAASDLAVVAVPALYRGKNVVEIGANAFKDKTTNASLDLSGATNLTTIAANAFENAVFTGDLNIISNVTTIGANAFTGTSFDNLIINGNIANGKNAFSEASFDSLTLNNVTIISESLFAGIIIVGDLNIPASVTTIGAGAFTNTSFTNLIVNGNITSGKNAFSGVSFDSLTLNNVTTISDSLFAGINIGSALVISTSVTNIETNAFLGAKFVGDIVIPANVNTIGVSAFAVASHNVIILNANLTNGVNAFKTVGLNGKFDRLIIGDTVTNIPDQLFEGMTLTDGALEIPASVMSIGNKAFGTLAGLTMVVFMHEVSAPVVGIFPFQGYGTSNAILVQTGSIRNEFLVADHNMSTQALRGGGVLGVDGQFIDYIYDASLAGYVAQGVNEFGLTLTNITVRIGATYDDEGTNGIKPVVAIKDSAFVGVTNLAGLYIVDATSLKTIGVNAFKNIATINALTIPANVTSIGNGAFDGSDFASFTFMHATPNSLPTIGTKVMANVPATVGIYVQNGGVYATFNTAGNPMHKDSRGGGSLGLTESHIIYVYAEGINNPGGSAKGFKVIGLTEIALLGTGLVVTIPEEHNDGINGQHPVLIIEANAFKGLTQVATFNLSNAQEIIEIGDGAFENTIATNKLSFSVKLKSIGARAFANSKFTGKLTIPASVGVIRADAFADTIFTGLTISGDVSTGANAFNGGSFGNLIITTGATYLSNRIFAGATFTGTVTIPTTIKTLADEIFAGAIGIESITFSHVNLSLLDGVGTKAFEGLGQTPIFVQNNFMYNEFISGNNVKFNMANQDMRGGGLLGIVNQNINYIYNGDNTYTANGLTELALKSIDEAFKVTVATITAVHNDGANGVYPVVSIATSAFENNTNIIEFIVEGTNLVTIGEKAFASTHATTGFNIPSSVITIEKMAFVSSTFINELVLPQGITTIGNEAFANTTFSGSLVLPASLTSIGDNAFAGNTVAQLFTAVTFMHNGEQAAALTVGTTPFASLPAAIVITVNTSLTYTTFTAQDHSLSNFDNRGGGILALSTSELIYVTVDGGLAVKGLSEIALRDATTVVVPASYSDDSFSGNIIEIGAQAFEGNELVTNYNLTGASNLQKISEKAFSSTRADQEYALPEALTYIGNSAFANSMFKGNLEIPALVAYIGNNAFALTDANSKQITLVTFNHFDVTPTIGTTPFMNLSPEVGIIIERIQIYMNLVASGNMSTLELRGGGFLVDPTLVYTFANGTYTLTGLSEGAKIVENLKITVPEMHNDATNGLFPVVAIAPDAFMDVANVIEFNINNASHMTDIGANSFKNTAATNQLILPISILTIGASAFEASSFTGDLVIPASVTDIKDRAFAMTTIAGKLSLHEGLKTIGIEAFSDTVLTGEVFIPQSVDNIGNSAFAGAQFSAVEFLRQTLPTIGNLLFDGLPTTTPIYVYNNIYVDATVVNSTSQLSSSNRGGGLLGVLADDDSDGAKSYRSNIYYEYVIAEDNTTKGFHVMGLTEYAETLTSGVEIVIGAMLNDGVIATDTNIIQIADNAFKGREQISKVTITSAVNLETIGKSAFEDTKAVSTLTGFNNMTSLVTIKASAFANSSFYGNLALPVGLRTVGDRAFYNVGLAGSLTIGEGVENIGNEAFFGVKFGGDVIFPKTLNGNTVSPGQIGNNAFAGALFSSVTFSKSEGENSIAPEVGTTPFLGLPSYTPIRVPNNQPLYNAFMTAEHNMSTPELRGGGYLVDPVNNYVFYDGSYTLSGLSKYGKTAEITTVKVPAEYYGANGMGAVDEIGREAFMGNTNITTFDLSQATGLLRIENNAFQNVIATKLDGIEAGDNDGALPNSITKIGSDAFNGSAFNGNLVLSSSLEAVTDRSFKNTKFIGNLIVPASVKSIGADAFMSSAFDGNLTLNDGLESIGQNAFNGAAFVSELVIPATVGSISDSAFGNMTGILSFKFNHTDASNLTIGKTLFSGITKAIPIYVGSQQVYDAFTAETHEMSTVAKRGGGYIVHYSLTFAFIDGSYSVTGFTEVVKDQTDYTITIPAIYNLGAEGEASVTSIAANAFENSNGKIFVFTNAKYLVTIGDSAFKGVNSSAALVLDAPVLTTIENNAFNGSTFIGDLILSASIITIGDSVFAGSAFTGELVIPANVVNMGVNAFATLAGFTKITLEHATALESANIGAGLFSTTASTVEIHVQDSKIYDAYEADGHNMSTALRVGGYIVHPVLTFIFEDGAYTVSGMTAIAEAKSTVDTTVPATYYDGANGVKYVVAIGSDAFANNKTIANFDLSTAVNLLEVRDNAFKGAKATNLLAFPNSLITIGNGSFDGSAFTGALNLVSVTTIGNEAFANTAFNDALDLSVVTEIGNKSFANTTFTGDLVLPTDLAIIGDAAFENASFTGGLSYPATVTSVGTGIFTGAKFSGNLTIEAGVTKVADGLFEGSLFEGKLTIQDGVQIIGASAFKNTLFSGDLAFPQSVITVGANAFNTTNLGGVLTIGIELINIGEQAFANNSFVQIVLNHTVALQNTTIGANIFAGLDSVVGIYVTSESLINAYTQNEHNLSDALRGGGKLIYNILTYTFNDNGGYVLTGLDEAAAVAKNVKVVVPAVYNTKLYGTLPVVEIAANAFQNETYVVEFDLSNAVNLVTIGANAFENTTANHALLLPANLVTIGNSAFAGSAFTGDLVIPNSVTTIEANAFSNMMNMTGSLTLGESLQTIGASAFQGAFTGELGIPATVVSIAEKAFFGNKFTGDLNLSEGNLTTIGEDAFRLTKFDGDLTIGSNVTSIDTGAFAGVAFRNVVLTHEDSTTLATIGATVFNGLDAETPVIVANKTVFDAYSAVGHSMSEALRGGGFLTFEIQVTYQYIDDSTIVRDTLAGKTAQTQKIDGKWQINADFTLPETDASWNLVDDADGDHTEDSHVDINELFTVATTVFEKLCGLEIDALTEQTTTYNGSSIPYLLSGNDATLEGFEIDYVDNAGNEFLGDKVPTEPGTYDVTISRAATTSHVAYEGTLANGLKIDAGHWVKVNIASTTMVSEFTGSGVAYNITGDDSALGGFNITYIGANVDYNSIEAPVLAGIYNVEITRAIGDPYFAMIQTIEKALTINAGVYSLTSEGTSVVTGIGFVNGTSLLVSGADTSTTLVASIGKEALGFYNIKLMLNGAEVNPTGTMTVTLKVNDGIMKRETVTVSYMSNGALVSQVVDVSGTGFITFDTASVGEFMVQATIPPVVEEEGSSLLWLAIVGPIVGVLLIGAVVFIILKKNKAKKLVV